MKKINKDCVLSDFSSIYYNLLDKANEKGLIRFIFVYSDDYYISEWRNGIWCGPIKITKLLY